VRADYYRRDLRGADAIIARALANRSSRS